MAVQEFAHPQARFLHEKQRTLSPRARHWLAGLLAAINRASFKAIDGAMFVGTVRLFPCHRLAFGPERKAKCASVLGSQSCLSTAKEELLTMCCVSVQADILATFRKKVLKQPSLFSLKHYHRPLVSACLCPSSV